MARKKQTRGKCAFCGREMTRGGMSLHLRACPERKAAMKTASQESGKEQTLYTLQVRDASSGNYWLYLEMKGSARLADLDRYLRAIWLECCGHLSQFSISGRLGEKIPMSRRINRVFGSGDSNVELTHIYDFGTSSYTLVRALDTRQGKPLTLHPIYLMARNNPPEILCIECGEPASWLCVQCLYETETSGAFCEEHIQEHRMHDDYGPPMEIVNSPRLGMCAYSGPAEPPY
ncbi:MAG: hypothetical protein ACP5HM_11795 [Anaerolineae bacterium]